MGNVGYTIRGVGDKMRVVDVLKKLSIGCLECRQKSKKVGHPSLAGGGTGGLPSLRPKSAVVALAAPTDS